MKRKTRAATKSNSDRKIEQLYNEALRNAKEGRLLNCNPKQETTAEKDVTKNNFQITKKNIRPKDVMQEITRKQKEREKQRLSFKVPVSRLLPFKTESVSYGGSRSVSRCGYDGEASEHRCNSRANTCTPSSGYFSSDVQSETSFENVLLVLPLRASEDESTQNDISANENNIHIARSLPPIYRTTAWTNTIRSKGPCASIPSRGTVLTGNGVISLRVWRGELHSRRIAAGKKKN